MHISLKSILALLGVNLDAPLALIEEIGQLVGQPALAAELKAHVTPARAAQLATEFTQIAADFTAQNWDAAATHLLDVLGGIT